MPLGRAVRVEVGLREGPPDVAFSLVSMDGATLRRFNLAADRDESGTLTDAGEVTLPTSDFRVRVAGR